MSIKITIRKQRNEVRKLIHKKKKTNIERKLTEFIGKPTKLLKSLKL